MPRFKVQVLKKTESSTFITVEANEPWAAEEIAIEQAATTQFPETHQVEYEKGTVETEEIKEEFRGSPFCRLSNAAEELHRRGLKPDEEDSAQIKGVIKLLAQQFPDEFAEAVEEENRGY